MNTDKILTPAEIDILAKAYLDCKLTKLQEKELELVLASTDCSSPVIDEAREAMQIGTFMASMPRHRTRRRTTWFAAAAILILMICGAYVLFSSHSEPSIEVYADGNRLDSELAVKKAFETEALCLAKMQSMLTQAENNRVQSMKLIQTTNIQ